MMWLLLFGLTALVIVLPLVPAWIEWRWPTDVVPLFIDKDDALDPPYLARSFISRLGTAHALGQRQMGRSKIVMLLARSPWPLDTTERRRARSRRVWDVVGDAELPAGVVFLGEVAARGSMHAAPSGTYRALWAGVNLHLPPKCTVLRWAHATQVEVGPACRLAGRVTADELITVGNATSFVLLHAPRIQFEPVRSRPAPATATAPAAVRRRLNAMQSGSVQWDAASARGTSEDSLDTGDLCWWQGDLICGADLRVGQGSKVDGSLKARGSITIGAGCTIEGSIVAEGDIRLGPGCTVRGSVISETSVALRSGSVVGQPGHPCTVAAPRIRVSGGVVAHGTVWAGERGRCVGKRLARSAAARTPALAQAQAQAKAQLRTRTRTRTQTPASTDQAAQATQATRATRATQEALA
jgi:hypothetical protein